MRNETCSGKSVQDCVAWYWDENDNICFHKDICEACKKAKKAFSLRWSKKNSEQR